MKILKRLLITGANGKLGSICRTRLRHLADIIRISSQNDLCKINNNEVEEKYYLLVGNNIYM